MIEFTPLSAVFLSIGPLKFHYYGLMYVFAFAFMYFMIPYLFRIRKVGIKKDQFEDLFFWGILGALLGGRLFYVLFYNFTYFFENPLSVFAVWEGGMASHGGFIGSVMAIYFICKKYTLSFLSILDAVAIPVGVGLMLGRFGNFINGELFGRVTDVSWCMNFKEAEGCRHPSQLYAMLKDVILFSIMFYLRDTQWKQGVLALVFVALYATFRFIVEFFREPDAHIGYLGLNLSQGQWLSLFMFFISLISMYYIIQRKKV